MLNRVKPRAAKLAGSHKFAADAARNVQEFPIVCDKYRPWSRLEFIRLASVTAMQDEQLSRMARWLAQSLCADHPSHDSMQSKGQHGRLASRRDFRASALPAHELLEPLSLASPAWLVKIPLNRRIEEKRE